jgi:hydrogenase maturation protease
VLILGVGTRYRRDDGAGLAATGRLRGRLPREVRVLEREGDLAGVLELWEGANAVIVIDATSSGSRPGEVRRLDAHAAALPAVFARGSTHAFGVAEAVELARALGRLPARVVVFGIEGKDFSAGEELSPEVDSAVDEVVGLVLSEVAGHA